MNDLEKTHGLVTTLPIPQPADRLNMAMRLF